MTPEQNNIDWVTLLTNTVIPAKNTIEVTKVEAFSAWDYDTLNYVTRWSNGETKPLTLRTYQNPVCYWQLPDPYKRDRVWAVLRRLRLESYPAPHVIARGTLENAGFLIWHTQDHHNWHAENAPSLNLLPQLAELLAHLHQIDPSPLNDEPLYQATIAGSLVRMLLWSREIADPDLKPMIRRLKATLTTIEPWQHRLIHGDPHLGNVQTHNGKIVTLLNWENAAIGDPRWDVMTAAHAIRQSNLKQADRFVNRYETFTGRTIDNRDFWYALISTRLWALKSWVKSAVDAKKVSAKMVDWTADLAIVKKQAQQDLQLAGL